MDNSFPDAHAAGYDLRSPVTSDYNCVAWAVDVDYVPWWPSFDTGDDCPYWPPGVPREVTLDAFVAAVGTVGYGDCGQDGSLEAGYEKLALYALDRDGTLRPKHLAWQMPDGAWSSKLGDGRDIVHTTPDALTSSDPGTPTKYGAVVKYLKRERRPRSCAVPTPTSEVA